MVAARYFSRTNGVAVTAFREEPPATHTAGRCTQTATTQAVHLQSTLLPFFRASRGRCRGKRAGGPTGWLERGPRTRLLVSPVVAAIPVALRHTRGDGDGLRGSVGRSGGNGSSARCGGGGGCRGNASFSENGSGGSNLC
ncbi:unnamed protein product [Phaeothamnion confervicola]